MIERSKRGKRLICEDQCTKKCNAERWPGNLAFSYTPGRLEAEFDAYKDSNLKERNKEIDVLVYSHVFVTVLRFHVNSWIGITNCSRHISGEGFNVGIQALHLSSWRGKLYRHKYHCESPCSSYIVICEDAFRLRICATQAVRRGVVHHHIQKR